MDTISHQSRSKYSPRWRKGPVSKHDLAVAYSPELKYPAAERKFRRRINDNPYIMKALKKKNYKNSSKKLTIKQLRVIFNFLGEP